MDLDHAEANIPKHLLKGIKASSFQKLGVTKPAGKSFDDQLLEMKIIKLLSARLFGLFCGIFGWQFGRHCGVEPQVEKRIVTVKEVQEMVGAEPDGIIGPETIEKWIYALNNQDAAKFDYMYQETK